MKRILTKSALFAALICTCLSCQQPTTTAETAKTTASTALPIPEKDVIDAYVYSLARFLVIRQEAIDVAENNLGYNAIKYNPLGQASFVNPNLDVAYLEAWLAVDANTPVILEVPPIKGRYYTVQIMDEWADVITNINNRNYPQHPYGLYAICLKGSSPSIPAGALRVDIPSQKAKVLARVERKGNDAEAVKLQHAFKISKTGNPEFPPVIPIPSFTNQDPIRVQLFDKQTLQKVLSSAPDPMKGADQLQKNALAVADFVSGSDTNKKTVDALIKQKALPQFMHYIATFGVRRGGWSTTAPYVDGFNNEPWFRTAANFGGIWWNVSKEVVYFLSLTDPEGQPLSGDSTYTIHFSNGALPSDEAQAFWSLTMLGTPDYKVVPNPLNRYNLSNQSRLHFDSDGSLTLAVGAKPKSGVALTNWLPGPSGKNFSLNLRIYAPKQAVLTSQWFAPPLQKLQ